MIITHAPIKVLIKNCLFFVYVSSDVCTVAAITATQCKRLI
jgi:hypothetical protein